MIAIENENGTTFVVVRGFGDALPTTKVVLPGIKDGQHQANSSIIILLADILDQLIALRQLTETRN